MKILPHTLRKRSAALGLSVLGLAGCAVGPDFKSPAPPAVAGYTATPLPVQTASAPGALGGAQRFIAGQSVADDWWKAFGSAKLDALVRRALQHSPTIAAAQATLRQAKETYAAQSGATLYPQVGATLGAQTLQNNSAAMGLPGAERRYDLYNAGLGVSYALDLSGGNRRALEALAAQTDWRRYQLEGARLTLIGSLVATAVNQAVLAEQVQALERLLVNQRGQLQIMHERVRLGVATDSDVAALQTQIEQTRASIPPLRSRLEQTAHLLAVLSGQAPGLADDTRFTLSDFTLPNELPLSLPSELARQRPDILAAEALLHAASAQIGVTVAKQYPQLTLSPSVGSQALTAASLFSSGSLIWGLAAQLAQPVFKPGLKAEERAAQAGFDAAAANYRETVLQGLRQVADALRALEYDAQALQAQTGADAAAQRFSDLAERQYALGSADALQLLIAQQKLEQARLGLIAAQGARLIDTAALYQALGGGLQQTPRLTSSPV
ncbi:efflux transporter outer membrane subunit [Thiomonas bhubaneswarensis]|uniref:Efflux transporter, outer membrane factor (OMF) lipoprotein, NodT family n=1 Tax=Thiomonas bhubaneswarensis TaxID=339866 RepID=A0A0K6I9S9_9BURK|nr:efflux transporter outer membrane subunit [Thiomonas bhubaneswarensis]CUA99869.1 efflux transporter, outer membrane factor (OMF) lipoprotein, NodT family [Thiomonas bhubaneswarensis]